MDLFTLNQQLRLEHGEEDHFNLGSSPTFTWFTPKLFSWAKCWQSRTTNKMITDTKCIMNDTEFN